MRGRERAEGPEGVVDAHSLIHSLLPCMAPAGADHDGCGGIMQEMWGEGEVGEGNDGNEVMMRMLYLSSIRWLMLAYSEGYA